jgi:hypothetical protein
MFSFGVGMGLDYGGFGANFLLYPQKNIGIFAGAGYAIAGVGYNVGGKLRFLSDKNLKRTSFYLTAMYGYNAAIKIVNADNYNKLFYGTTIGFGIDLRNKNNKGLWTFGLLIPIRISEVDEYIDDLTDNLGVDFKNELMPVAISAGYRIRLD